ncbi:hypothetical protein [Vibrio crassostreae]|uniref:hypothetical protein n=1 Tax=Vibrio crassostreae TaxID=246167 RepID=UPI0006308FEA|nr:hypothetical protein [Vibrio crassostreae]TCO00584.1 hypothetical protein EDB30_111157 [Vibrio crassostreae]CAK2051176.1 RiboL-PSP-HEPN domain-containing protein [Vibrio crassostreae]CAK2064152.1 RiboL-PSP-HEPN domain-containing protein [Vibrio crassostreae]CAK2065541.1 RiboL-PSP-HEPN domain-containing protein [Vibrio crassostreae]CAK2068752.1 RiboL-PSP-HEPN domain-containing protein [Vibrio crassostreae]
MQNNLKFSSICSFLIKELDLYKAHVRKVELLLASEVETFNKELLVIIEQLNESDANGFKCYREDDFFDLSVTFPLIQRKSELISAYTILENGLNKVCEIFEENIDNPIKLSDLSAHGIIDKSKKYLEKVAKINFPCGDDTAWVDIQLIQQIRNVFVHNEGVVKSGNKQLISYIIKSPFLELKPDFKIFIKEGFSYYCLQQFQEFFFSLFSEIDRSKKI